MTVESVADTLRPALAWADAHVDLDRVTLTDVLGAFAAGHRAAAEEIARETGTYWRREAAHCRGLGWDDLAHRYELLAAVLERETVIDWSHEP